MRWRCSIWWRAIKATTLRRALGEESVALLREVGDPFALAHALQHLGLVALDQGDHDAARALEEESVRLSQRTGGYGRLAHGIYCLGVVAMAQGDYPEADSRFEEALALGRE